MTFLEEMSYFIRVLWKWVGLAGLKFRAIFEIGKSSGLLAINKLVIFDKLSTIMFFGKILTQGQSYKFSPDQAEASQGQVLSLTNVVWAPTSKDAASLWIKKDNAQFLLASLNKEKSHAAINVFISLLDEVTLTVKGNGVLHVTGFFEPDQQGDLPLGEQELESDEDEEEDEDEELEVKPATKLAVPAKAPSKVMSPQQKPQSPQQKAQSPQQKAQVPAKAAAKKQEVEEESDDEDEDLEDEDLDDEIDDEEQEDDDEEEEEDDDDDDEEIEAPPQKHVKHDGPKPQFKQNQGGKPQGGKPNFHQGGKPNFHQGGKPNFQQGGKPGFNKGGNKPWNNNNNQKGGNKPWNNNNNQKGGKPWGNNNQKGGKPFNKGGKNFQKH